LSSFIVGNKTGINLCSDSNFGAYCTQYYRDDDGGSYFWNANGGQGPFTFPYGLDTFNYLAHRPGCDPGLAVCNDWTSSIFVW